MPRKSILAVSPTRNEARSAPLVLAEIASAAELLSGTGWEIALLVVDDQSTDGTVDVIEREAKLRGIPVTIVEGPRLGVSRALTVGLAKALEMKPTLIATLDFDGQHDASQLPALVELWERSRDVDAVFGTRFAVGASVTGVHGFRKLVSRTAQVSIRAATVGPTVPSDSTTSFRVFTPLVAGQFLEDVPSRGLDGYRFFSWFAVFISCRYSFAEVPITFRPRLTGVSKLRMRDLVSFVTGLRELRNSSKDWIRQAQRTTLFPEYPNEYLDDLGELARYNDWILSTFRSSLHGHVLEVGAGTGTMTQAIAELPAVGSIIALEPDPVRFDSLVDRTSALEQVTPMCGTTDLVEGTFDCVLYCNSLEHIDGVLSELRMACDKCARGATLVIFGPAMELIYGEVDRRSGHFRRFSGQHLARTVEDAGFEILSAKYHDPVGAVLYGFSNRVLGSGTLRSGFLPLYERVILPVSRSLSGLTSRVAGKNLVLVARKR